MATTQPNRNVCHLCHVRYKDVSKHYLWKCLFLPQQCVFCGVVKDKQVMDTHVYRDCGEYMI